MSGNVNFNLSFFFALVFLFASIFYVMQVQTERLTFTDPDAVFVDRGFATLVPTNARIVIGVDPNGEYVLGKTTTANSREAINFLKQEIETLLNAGISPTKITIVGVTPHDIRHQDHIWVLREAFENVRGRQLLVLFENEFPPD